MHNFIIDKYLRRRAARRSRRAAFSLAELVISIGILALMMTLAGQVFSLSAQTTGQATALANVSRALRALERALREDLREVQRGQSVLVIAGIPVNGYWTAADREGDGDGNPLNGYPHARDEEREDANGNLQPPRADLIMFFTSRRSQSTVYPEVTSQVQQVVYGHAQLGEYVPDPLGTSDEMILELTPDAFPPWPEIAPTPAEGWHLARRSMLLTRAPSPVNPPTSSSVFASIYPNLWVTDLGLVADLTDPDRDTLVRIIEGDSDVVEKFNFEEQVLMPAPNSKPPLFLPPFFLAPNGNPQLASLWRSRLDPSPPPRLASRLGHYFLPNCASFKVEWALDPRSNFVAGRFDPEKRLFWFDPGNLTDPLAELTDAIMQLVNAGQIGRSANLQQLLTKDPVGTLGVTPPATYTLAERFRDDREWWELSPINRPNVVYFGANRLTAPPGRPGSKVIPDPIFPVALRITVEVFDDQRRLGRPTRHVMIIPLGDPL